MTDVSEWITATGQEFGMDLAAQVDILAQNGAPCLFSHPFSPF
jgi:hypothetical protein